MNDLKRPSAVRSRHPDPLGIDQADQQYLRALQAYKHSGAKAALGLLSEALRLDPTLSEDQVIRKIASEALGLPQEQAVRTLTQAAARQQRFRFDHGGWRPAVRRNTTRTLIVLLFTGLVAVLLMTTGAFDLYIGSLQTQQWREHLRTNRTEFQLDYYLFVPDTPPPADGWRMLMLIHDYGADADSIVSPFIEGAKQAGVILIAPTLGAYPEPLEAMTLPALDAVLIEVRSEYPANPKGVVLFGYGEGGTLATYYAREYFQVAAVATVAAPQLFPPPDDDASIPYLLMYGGFGYTQDEAELSIAQFHSHPNALEVLVMPGLDDDLAVEQMRLTLELAQKLYAVE